MRSLHHSLIIVHWYGCVTVEPEYTYKQDL